jgi:hypothetical protein
MAGFESLVDSRQIVAPHALFQRVDCHIAISNRDRVILSAISRDLLSLSLVYQLLACDIATSLCFERLDQPLTSSNEHNVLAKQETLVHPACCKPAIKVC